MLKLDFEHAIKRALCILKILVKGVFLGKCPLKNRRGEKFTPLKEMDGEAVRGQTMLDPKTTRDGFGLCPLSEAVSCFPEYPSLYGSVLV